VDLNKAQTLEQGTRVGAPSLGKKWYATGTVAFNIPYGLGVRFDDYPWVGTPISERRGVSGSHCEKEFATWI